MNLIRVTGNIMRKLIHILAQIKKSFSLNIDQYVLINMGSNVNLRSTNVKTVLAVHFVHYVQKQKKETIGS